MLAQNVHLISVSSSFFYKVAIYNCKFGETHILSFISDFQLRVRAFDLGTPSLAQSQLALVTLSVIRNNGAPQFILTPYAATISRDLNVGNSVYTVSATDIDFNSFSNVSINCMGEKFQD